MPKKQKSGLYRSKVKIGTNSDGTPLVKWVSGKSTAELEAAKTKVKEFYIAGTGLREDKLFGVFAIEWYRTRKEPRLSESSKAGYRSMFNKRLLPKFADRNLRAITATELQAWFNTLSGMSDTTITLAITILSGVFSAAKADRIISVSPASDLTPPIPGASKTRRALTSEESGSLLRLIDKLLLDKDRVSEGIYLAILYYLGLRPGEARGLQWGDFDWSTDSVHIMRDIDYAKRGNQIGKLKTEAAERDVPVPAELRAILYSKREHLKAFVLRGKKSNEALSKTSAECIWLRCMIDIGLARRREKPRKCNDIRAKWEPIITPYYLRHNYITLCWEAGLDPLVVMRIVGHKDYRTTANIYTHLNAEHIKKVKIEIESIFAERAKSEVAQKLHKPPSILRV